MLLACPSSKGPESLVRLHYINTRAYWIKTCLPQADRCLKSNWIFGLHSSQCIIVCVPGAHHRCLRCWLAFRFPKYQFQRLPKGTPQKQSSLMVERITAESSSWFGYFWEPYSTLVSQTGGCDGFCSCPLMSCLLESVLDFFLCALFRMIPTLEAS